MSLKKLLLCLYMRVCTHNVGNGGFPHATVYPWKSEYNFVESSLSFYLYIGSGDPTPATRLEQVLLPADSSPAPPVFLCCTGSLCSFFFVLSPPPFASLLCDKLSPETPHAEHTLPLSYAPSPAFLLLVPGVSHDCAPTFNE